MHIKIKNLVKRLSPGFELNISDIEFANSEIIALVGANGAGKTTFLKLLMGYIESDYESITISNNYNASNSIRDLNSTSFIDSKSLIEFLTIEEYFDLFKQINILKGYNGPWNDTIIELLLNEEIHERKLIRELSIGTQVKVGICACFLRFYDLVILDEPFSHLDPPSQEVVCNIIINYIKETELKTIVIFSSHDLRNVAKLANSVIFLKHGKVSKQLNRTEINTDSLESLFRFI